jgi:cytochrome c oxidase subunit II
MPGSLYTFHAVRPRSRSSRLAYADRCGRFLRRASIWVLALFGLTACENGPSILDPAGPAARRVEGLWWLMFWISVVVFLVVVGFILVSMRRSRHVPRLTPPPVDRSEVSWGDKFVAIAGVFVPAVILGGVYLLSLGQMNELSKAGQQTSMSIEVVGHDWWWEVRYPNGAITANEIHIPVGERVNVQLASDDVIHSFWVPQLQVKIDNIPGHDTQLWLEADERGRYRGQCAEFCGLQHANMAFFVVAEDPDDFDAWVANEAADAASPTDSDAQDGEEVFLSASCAGCHAIRGTETDAELGPDLTHLATRQTIAAGTLTNTRDNLRRFIIDPQVDKPGAVMPPTELSESEIEVLLDYLEQLD